MADNFLGSTFSVANKSVLITGASSGFGEHFTRVLSRAGCGKIAILARRTDRLESLAKELREAHPGLKIAAVQCDLADIANIPRAFDAAEQALETVFDVVVNNAGLGVPRAVLKVDEAHYDKHVDINVKACWFVAQEAAKRLIAAKLAGSIINVSSIYGLRVGMGHGVYAVTKAGLTQMTKAMSLELVPHKIRVNSINPGYFLTEINADYYSTDRGKAYIQTMPAKRLGQLDELNGALLLLASDASQFMYGAVITIDGAHAVSSL